MSRTLLSPRDRPAGLGDFGERSPFIGRQRIGRVPARSRSEPRQRLRRALRLAAVILVVLGTNATAAAWLLTSPRFAVDEVQVRGASQVPAERIRAVAGIAAGANLWRIDPAAVIARLEALPEIHRAELIRELPNRVTVLVEERRPFTLVSGGRLHWLDEEGRLLGEARQAVVPPVPVISGLTEEELAAMRTEPGPKVKAAIALIRSLLRSGSALATEISEIDMSRREGPVLYTVDGIEVTLGPEDWDERLARLEGVLAQVAGQGAPIRTIDLRFRDQVILKRGDQG